MDITWDYVVIGAGSSGCVMAERLSRDPAVRVLLIEAGGPNWTPMVTMPKGIGKLALNRRYALHYPVAQPRMPGMPSTETWVRGRGLGGSSAINGMIWVRGQPRDYDLWEEHGAAGWNWSVMREAFAAIEDHELGPGDGRGVGGPVPVSPGKFRYREAEAAIAAGMALGLPRKEDLNTEDQEGIGYYSHNIRKGERWSAARAFVNPARGRANFAVRTGTRVRRIVFDGRRVCGVEVEPTGAGADETIAVAGEVVLSAGSIESPAILQRSGVGPGAVLRGAGVAVVTDSPLVGQNLLDHLGMSIAYRLRTPGNNHHFRGIGLALSALRYALTRGGPLATGPYEVGGFARLLPESQRPDLQIYAGAFTFARGGNPNFPVQLSKVEEAPGFTIYGQLLALDSPGSIAITAPGPEVTPTITPNWLASDHDQRMAIAAIRLIRRFAAQSPLAELLGEELSPGAHIESDGQVLETVQRLGRAGTHAVGTCAMGGEGAVLDPDCRVRGVEGLRVVDCSAMPGLVSANTNAPAMALAWQAANRMLAASRAGS